MTPADILEGARADGVHLMLSPAGTIKATGDSAAVNRWVPALRAHKCEIVAALLAGAGGTVFGWRLHFADADGLEVTFAPPVDHADALAAYPDAIAAEPIPEPPAVPIPADLAAMFDACAKAGLYDDADRAALPAMFAIDAEETRALVGDRASRIK